MSLKFLSFSTGYKTYIAVGIGIALAIAEALGLTVPGLVYIILGFLGLGFQRSAIGSNKNSIQTIVQDVLSQITIPDVEQEITTTISTTTSTPTETPSAVRKGAVVKDIVIGEPSPKDRSEESVTDDLNKAQLQSGKVK